MLMKFLAPLLCLGTAYFIMTSDLPEVATLRADIKQTYANSAFAKLDYDTATPVGQKLIHLRTAAETAVCYLSQKCAPQQMIADMNTSLRAKSDLGPAAGGSPTLPSLKIPDKN